MTLNTGPHLEVDVVVQDDSTVLLVQLNTPHGDAKGWRLPGDTLRFGEAPETCARRVLNERLALAPEEMTLAEVESAIDSGVWRLTFHFRCIADRRPAPSPGVAEARFFQLEHLPAMARGDQDRDAIYRVVMA